MRDAIAVQTNMIAREAKKDMVQAWLNISAEDLPAAVTRYGWSIEGDLVKIPINKENEAKTTVFRENVQFNRMRPLLEFTRVYKLIDPVMQSSRTSSREVTSRPFKWSTYHPPPPPPSLPTSVSISHAGFSLFGALCFFRVRITQHAGSGMLCI